MAGLVKKFLASASVVAGMSAVFGAPAMAATFNAIEGSDLVLRTYNETDGFKVDNSATLDSILVGGNSSNPGGNVELGSNDDGTDPLSGVKAQNAEGKTISFTNVTKEMTSTQEFKNVFTDWFDTLWGQASEKNPDAMLVKFFTKEMAQGIFEGVGLTGMITDPNISYINEVGNDIVVGLAGHLNLANRFKNDIFLERATQGVQMSEIFAYKIDDGDWRYGWTSSVTDSQQADSDAAGSFSGNYEVVLKGLADGYFKSSADVPEPSTVLGLMAIGGLVAATKRKSGK